MRYNKEIYFQKLEKGNYNPDTGDYEDGFVDETLAFASIMDTQTENMTMLYGKPKQGALTIHIKNPHVSNFDFIRIDDTVYQVDYSRNNKVFLVSERA